MNLNLLIHKGKYIIAYSVLTLIIPFFASAQNLIINGSFEFVNSDVNYTTPFEMVTPWLGQSVKLFSLSDSCPIKNIFPNNIIPADGNNICGVMLYKQGDRQILSGKLSEKLIKDKKYVFSFKYHLPKNKKYKNFLIDYCFSENIDKRGNAPFSANKSMNCLSFYPESSSNNWHLFTDTITAKGDEKYFIIWHMNDEKNSNSFYYYFDDFILIPLESLNHNTINKFR